MEFNLAILTLAEVSSRLDIIAVNLPYLLIVMPILANMALNSYTRQRQNQLYLSYSIEMKGEDEAMLYLDCLGELARKVENEE